MFCSHEIVVSDHPFTEPIIIPFTKNLWNIGYTNRIGSTTITDTVIRMDVGVCCVAIAAIFIAVPALFFTIAARELAWLIYVYSRYCSEYNF